MGAASAAMCVAGKSNGSSLGCSTSVGWWCATNIMPKTFKAFSTSAQRSSSCAIYEMASRLKYWLFYSLHLIGGYDDGDGGEFHVFASISFCGDACQLPGA